MINLHYSKFPERFEKKGISRFLYIIFGIVLICLIGIFSLLLIPEKSVCGNDVCDKDENCITCREDCTCPTGLYCSKKYEKCVESMCGNDVCEKDENCITCLEDCKCPTGQYCSENKCVKPVCGDDVCELFEDPQTCCIDCGCWTPGEICNMTLNLCQKGEIKISDQEVMDTIISYYQNKGVVISPSEIDIKGITTYQNKVVKQVLVKTDETFSTLLVTEEKEIIEITM